MRITSGFSKDRSAGRQTVASLDLVLEEGPAVRMPSGRVTCDNCGGTVYTNHRYVTLYLHPMEEPAHWCRQCTQLAQTLLERIQSWLIGDDVSRS